MIINAIFKVMTQKKNLWAAAFGSTLELYDFTLYAAMIQTLAVKFFPSSDPKTALLASLATFASGFIVRPLGGLLWGFLGDRFGRRFSLSYALLLMALPTLSIGFLPTYHDAGFFATIGLIICRVLQGLSMSGEFNGAMIFAFEHTDASHKGRVSAFINSVNFIGIAAAMLLGMWVVLPGMPEWAWRVPFFFGAFVGVIGFFIRRNLDETPQFLKHKAQAKSFSNLLKSLFKNPHSSMIVFVQSGYNGLITYTMISFFIIYLTRYLELSKSQALPLVILVQLSCVVMNFGFGRLVDRFGVVKILKSAALFVILGALPGFYLLGLKTNIALVLGVLICSSFMSVFAVCTHSFIQEQFPVENRFTGVAFFYNLGMSLVGGTAPMLMTWSIESTGNVLSPAIVFIAATIVYSFVLTLHSKRSLEKVSSKKMAII